MWNTSQTSKWKKVLKVLKKQFVILILHATFQHIHSCNNYAPSIEAQYLYFFLYSIVKNQRRAILQPKCHNLILRRYPVWREKPTATQRNAARSSIQPWIHSSSQEMQQIVHVQEHTFSFASWHLLICRYFFSETEVTILIFVWACC